MSSTRAALSTIVVATDVSANAGVALAWADQHAHGLSGMNRLLLGSTAERVVASAPCPVLTMRRESA